MIECRLGAGPRVRAVLSVRHRGARLAPRAYGLGEARHTGGGERAPEFVEGPGWVEVDSAATAQMGADVFRLA